MTKKLGGAVVRNRIRRRLQAAVALLAPDERQGRTTMSLIARPAAQDRPFPDLQKDLDRAFRGVHHPRDLNGSKRLVRRVRWLGFTRSVAVSCLRRPPRVPCENGCRELPLPWPRFVTPPTEASMSQQPDNQNNLLIAVVLSMAVMLGWQYFYAGAQMKARARRPARSAPARSRRSGQGAAPQGAPGGATRPGMPTRRHAPRRPAGSGRPVTPRGSA